MRTKQFRQIMCSRVTNTDGIAPVQKIQLQRRKSVDEWPESGGRPSTSV